jgi:hypothetical protein
MSALLKLLSLKKNKDKPTSIKSKNSSFKSLMLSKAGSMASVPARTVYFAMR